MPLYLLDVYSCMLYKFTPYTPPIDKLLFLICLFIFTFCYFFQFWFCIFLLYFSKNGSYLWYNPACCVANQRAIRTAPVANTSLRVATCLSSNLSPGPANHTVCSPIVSPTRKL